MHGSRLVQQVINKVMVDGKKSLAERIVYDALEILSRRTSQPPVEALETSVKALTPVLEVRSRRVGGATYQVPVEVPARRARTLAVRWLVQFARERREKTMAERLAGELSDAQSDQGAAFKRKEDIYRIALARRSRASFSSLRSRCDGGKNTAAWGPLHAALCCQSCSSTLTVLTGPLFLGLLGFRRIATSGRW